jgi:hypothetical protein
MKVNDTGKRYGNIRCWNIELPVRAVIDNYIYVQNFVIVSRFYFIHTAAEMVLS